MAEQQVIRIRMRNRPGALSQICTALAAHGVDIIHLDVVSAHDGVVVDDIALEGKAPGDIARAVRSFLPDVQVAPLPGGTTVPVIEFGDALVRIAGSEGEDAALEALAVGAGLFLRANQSLFLRMKPDTGRLQSSVAGIPEIEAGEVCSARAIFSPPTVATFHGSTEWAPPAFRAALGCEHAAIAPVGGVGVLLLTRQGDIAFTQGELQRLALFTRAGVALIPGISGETPTAIGGQLPPDSVFVPL